MKRHFLRGNHFWTLLVLVAFILALCPSALWAAEEKVIVFNGSGGALEAAQKKYYNEPFEKETGIKVIMTAPPNFAKLKAQVESGNIEWDIAELEPSHMARGVKLGYFEPVDFTIMDKSDMLPETVYPSVVPGGLYSTILAYNTKKFSKGNHPQSWKDFWDVKKFPGRRALRNSPENNLEMALLADGVPPEKIYPLDIDRAFRSLDRIKPHIAVWWKVGAQSAQIMVDQEVDMTTAWNGRITDIIRKGAPVEIEWNQNIMMVTYYGVVKGTKHKSEAFKYLAFRARPAIHAEFLKYGPPYPIPIKSLVKYLTPEIAKVLPTYPEYLAKAVKVNLEEKNIQWWTENGDKIAERWTAWMLK
jgi:putative spermidine/putrescine transport system substrate-binding protein